MFVDELYINNELNQFDNVSLNELSRVSLLNRIDTKYIGHLDQLQNILPAMKDGYLVLKNNENCSFEYLTTYMDTDELKFFADHHQGRVNRYKIRTREYVDSGQLFNEIKFKDNRSKTHKERIEKNSDMRGVDGSFLRFMQENKDLSGICNSLEPSLIVHYRRITFTDRDFTERITLDYGLRFNHEKKNELLGSIFILETKRARQRHNSCIEKILHHNKIYPGRISKYCLGIICTREGVKYNRFKPLIRKIQKINTQGVLQ